MVPSVTYFASERAFTKWVLEQARARGWTCAHFGSSMRTVRTKDGTWKSIPDRDAAGFPDLVLVRDRVLFVELKMHDKRSRLTEAQVLWLHALRSAGHVMEVWRPNDEDAIIQVLDGSLLPVFALQDEEPA